jgi:hypothetical protein
MVVTAVVVMAIAAVVVRVQEFRKVVVVGEVVLSMGEASMLVVVVVVEILKAEAAVEMAAVGVNMLAEAVVEAQWMAAVGEVVQRMAVVVVVVAHPLSGVFLASEY